MNQAPQIIQNKNERSEWITYALLSTIEARNIIPKKTAKALQILPLSIDLEGHLNVLAPSRIKNDPTKIQELNSQMKLSTNLPIKFEFKHDEEISKAIELSYKIKAIKINDTDESKTKIIVRDLSTQAEIPQFLEEIISQAIIQGASDIHLINNNEEGLLVKFRINGELEKQSFQNLSYRKANEIFRRIKILSDLDPTESVLPQEGSFNMKIHNKNINIRSSLIASKKGSSGFLRLPSNNIEATQHLSSLGLMPYQIKLLENFIHQQSGTLLSVGPTGSGKSHLIYSLLQRLDSNKKNIISIEDPIERDLHGISQLEVNFQKKINFSNLLKATLRHDPDYIYLGEIRDYEVAKSALDYGLTGKGILSTIHARDALEGIIRLISIGVSPYLISLSIRILVGQRLIAKSCSYCQELAAADLKLQSFFKLDPDTKIIHNKGCNRCNYKGSKDRIGIYEILSFDEEFSHELMSLNSKNISSKLNALKEIALITGFQPMIFALRNHLITGQINNNVALTYLNY